MDYGKLALLKIEDIERLLRGRAKSDGGIKMIAFELKGTLSSGEFVSEEAAFVSGEGRINAELSFFSQSPAACSVSLLIDGVPFDEKKVQASGQCVVSFFGDIPSGKHFLRAVLKPLGGSLNGTAGAAVRLWGEVSFAEYEGKLAAFEYGGLVRAACCDSESVRLYVYFEGELLPTNVFERRGDFCYCPLAHPSGPGYDLLYFFCDEGKLCMHAIAVYSGFSDYREMIDEGVTKVACAASDNPKGALLYYLKGGSVFIRHASLEGGRVRISAPFERVPLPKADRISAVRGLLKGAGFAATEKGGKNSLYLSDCGLGSLTQDTVCAVFWCGMEGLS